MLDAGHGGARTGAKTAAGVTEASIVLAITRHAKEVLERQGVRVVMTREEDRNVSLDARVALANASRAAAFVSVHSNHAPVPERRGTETYILSANSTDDAAAALVELENEPGEGEGGGGAPEPAGGGGSDLDFILQDLHKMTAHKDAALLARAVQDQLGAQKGLAPSRGLRQAPFKVLRGASLPAVLVEIGYLSHPTQGAHLATREGQRAAGEALARGIRRFLEQLDERL